MPIALKEWAVTVRALAEGEQLVTLRKGGIREEGKHFALEHERFFLYPTFDHQRSDLVCESHVPELTRALEDGVWSGNKVPNSSAAPDGRLPLPRAVRIRAWAEVADSYQITSQRQLDQLAPFHIWSRDYAAKRLNWKPSHPLHVLLLRTHKLARPVQIPVQDEHVGCKSWVDLSEPIEFSGKPAVADDEFSAAQKQISSLLATVTTR